MGRCHKGTKEYEQDDEIDVQFLALTHGHRGDSVLPEFIVSPFNFADITHFGLPRSEIKRREDNLGIWQKNNPVNAGFGFFLEITLTKKVNCSTFILQKSTYAGAEPNVAEKRVER